MKGFSERTPDEWDIEAWEKEKLMGEWISVNDRLPGEYKDVLIYGEKILDKPLIGYYILEWGTYDGQECRAMVAVISTIKISLTGCRCPSFRKENHNVRLRT